MRPIKRLALFLLVSLGTGGVAVLGFSGFAAAAEGNPILAPDVKQALASVDDQFGDLTTRMAGEVWGRPGLSNKERAFISLGADVCNQTLDGPLGFHAGMALQHGATRADVREALLHMVIYGSFPKVLQSIVKLNELYAEYDTKGLYTTGDGLTEPPPGDQNFVADPAVREALLGVDPHFGDLTSRMAGEVWGRGGLSQKERAFVSLGADVCNQTLSGPLQFHIDMAMRGGATREQVREALLHMTIYGSFPKVLQAIVAMNAHFATLDEKPSGSSQ
ncbi:MAG: carboxymuconolactone decarboxylase family protein [Gammaproteobacteria bacterium]